MRILHTVTPRTTSSSFSNDSSPLCVPCGRASHGGAPPSLRQTCGGGRDGHGGRDACGCRGDANGGPSGLHKDTLDSTSLFYAPSTSIPPPLLSSFSCY